MAHELKQDRAHRKEVLWVMWIGLALVLLLEDAMHGGGYLRYGTVPTWRMACLAGSLAVRDSNSEVFKQ